MHCSSLRRLQAVFMLPVFLLSTLAPLCSAVPQLMNYQGRVTEDGVNFDGKGYFKFALIDSGTNLNVTATATCTVSNSGRISSVTLTNGGSGYTSAPTVTFGGTGTGAVATATIVGDAVASITVSAAGGGFSTVTPTQVVIEPPRERIVTGTLWSNDGTGKEGGEPETAVELTVQKGLYAVLLGDSKLMREFPPQIFTNADVRLRVWFSSKGQEFTLLTPDQRIAAVGYALMADAVKPGGVTAEMLASNAIGLAQLTPELRQTILGLQAWQATQLPVVTSAGAAEASVDVPFTFQLAATGSPTAYAAAGLPAGWSLQTGTGLITATPTAAGTVNLSVAATNVAGAGVAKPLVITVNGPVFVDFATGNDGAPGTQAEPLKTLHQGLSAASVPAVRRGVRVSAATQSLTAMVNLAGGVPVRGGYDRAAGWTRTAPRTLLVVNPVSSAPALAVEARDLTEPVLFDGFTVTGPSALTAGKSAMGVRAVNCTQLVTISNCAIAAGNGFAGLPGAGGAAGAAGGDGFDASSYLGHGWPPNVPFSPFAAAQYRWGLGGTMIAETQFGSTVVSQYEGYPGISVAGAIGGDGGAPGNPSGSNGQPGGSASNASSGSHGVVASGIQLSDSFSSTPGGAGSDGGDGGSGAGGGGGGGISGINSPAYWGGGGGGGGKGGKGGAKGAGGNGGGGSFAVAVVNSPVTVTGCSLTTGSGGAGGTGGNGGAGGAGGQGGDGFITPMVNGFNPGNGGHGGDGGDGGGGGGGAGGQGGPSIGIIVNASGSVTQGSNTFSLGAAGTGGQGGLRGGSASNRAPTGATGARQNVLTGVTP